MKAFWDQRYGQEAFAYGEAPNEYLKAKLAEIPAGKILFPLEGEGRNAVYAATLGWEATAFDQSIAGQAKAALLAQKNGVHIDYTLATMEQTQYPEASFDALALIFAHFAPEQRKQFHQQLASYLKKEGLLIIEGFSKSHTEKQKENPAVGGPKEAAMLYDLEELKSDFLGFEFIESYQTDTVLQEGTCHIGKAAVVRVVAKKK